MQCNSINYTHGLSLLLFFWLQYQFMLESNDKHVNVIQAGCMWLWLKAKLGAIRIEIQQQSFVIVHTKTSKAKEKPFCSGFNALVADAS